MIVLVLSCESEYQLFKSQSTVSKFAETSNKIFFCFVCYRVLLCSTEWPQTCSVTQMGMNSQSSSLSPTRAVLQTDTSCVPSTVGCNNNYAWATDISDRPRLKVILPRVWQGHWGFFLLFLGFWFSCLEA